MLLEKLEKSEKGMSAKEMGDLFYGAEDELSDKGLIEWHWEKRGILWVKICNLIKREA